MSNGELREHANPDVLLQQVTGYALPVSRLSLWLLGRPGSDGELQRDANGRPQSLREAGWLVEYEYADANPAALPYILRINRAAEVMLTLRIEEWREAP
jgi:outer membrane lipoprotein LolB